jgi:CRISPR system Cascade subunit CasD
VKRDFLVYIQRGTIVSWGSTAVGDLRHTDDHPTKSGVTGQLCAALGIERSEEDLVRLMSQSYGFATIVDRAGELLRDYHTIRTPNEIPGFEYQTRADEIRFGGKKRKLNTIISTRDYRTGTIARIAIWVRDPETAPCSLEYIAEALAYPVFTLCIGRKSCPFSLPPQPKVVKAETLMDAFRSVKFAGLDKVKEVLSLNQRATIYWEESVEAGVDPQYVHNRNDQILSRKRWQFVSRKECRATIPLEEGGR